jgi:flagellar protein FliO/FliZ
LDPIDYLRFLAALAFVLGLIALCAWAARRWRIGPAASGAARRLAVLETLPIDARRKLVLVRCDQRQHLLLLGQDGNRVIAQVAGEAAAAPGVMPAAHHGAAQASPARQTAP